MFLVINAVACIGMINNVMYQFKDWDSFMQSVEASPTVPVMVVGDREPIEARRHLHNQLVLQHVAAVG